jgi:TP901 family phage tail tape measure protein
MANTVEYGLKFNADDLKKLEAMAKAIDKQNSEVIKKASTRQTKLYDENKKKNLEFNMELKKQLNQFILFEKDGYARKMAILKESLISQRGLKLREAKFETEQARKNGITILNAEKLRSQQSITLAKQETAEKIKLSKMVVDAKLRETNALSPLKIQQQQARTSLAELRLQKAQNQSSKGVANGSSGNYGTFSPVKRVAKYIATSTVVYQGLAAMKRGITAGVDYEQTMANTYSALGQVTEAEKLRMQQMALGANIVDKYAMSAKDVAASFEVLAKAGLNAKDSMQSFQPAMQLAKLSNQDLGISTQILAESLTELNKPMSYSQELVDKLAYAADKSTVNIGDIAESFKIAAPVAKQYGMSINELTANIAMFGKAGIKGREAGNALARIMLRLKKDSANPDVVAAIKNNKTFTDVLVDLQKRGYTGLTEVQKEFGLYAGKNVSQFMMVAKEAKGLTEQLDGGASVGSAMSKLNTIMDTTNNQIQRMKSAWDNLFISQDGINTIIGDTAGGLATVLNALKEFPQATKAVAACTAALGAMGILLASNPFTGAAMLIAGIGTAALGAAENIRKMNEEVRKSQGFNVGSEHDFSTGGILKTAEAAKKRFSAMNEDQLKQERYKLLGQKRLYDNFYKELYEKHGGEKSFWQQNVKDFKDAQSIIKKYTGKTVTGDEREKFIEESRKRYAANWQADFYLKMMSLYGGSEVSKESPISPKDTTTTVGGTGGGGKGAKEQKRHYDDLDSFLRSLQKLRNSYAEKELSDIEKIQAEINNTYNEKTKELSDKNIKFRDWELAQQEIENDRKIALENAYQKELADIKYKAMEEQNKKTNEQLHDHYQKIFDIYESSLEKYGSVKQRQKLLDEQYLTGFNAIKEEAALRNLSATETEELITNLKREHAEARIQIAYEAWQKENEIANGVLDSVGSAYSTLAQTMTDMDMTGKERREAIWESFRSTAITALMDVLKQQLINFALSKVFSASVTAATAAEAGILATAWTPAAYLASVATLGAAAGIGTAALAGGLASSAALTTGIGLFNNTGGLGGGFPVQDAVVADGKVYPYRKDDLVLAIGTGLGSKSGAQLPDKALPQGSNSSGGNMALINELRNLRLAVVRSDANNVKAIADNTPVFQGSVMDDVAVYKKSLTGKKKSNFIVAVDK